MKKSTRIKKVYLSLADRMMNGAGGPILFSALFIGGPIAASMTEQVTKERPSSETTEKSVQAIQSAEEEITKISALIAKLEKAGNDQEAKSIAGEIYIGQKSLARTLLSDVNLPETETQRLANLFSQKTGYTFAEEQKDAIKTAFMADCRAQVVVGDIGAIQACTLDRARDDKDGAKDRALVAMFGVSGLANLLIFGGGGLLRRRFEKAVEREASEERDRVWQERYAKDRAVLEGKIKVRSPGRDRAKQNLL